MKYLILLCDGMADIPAEALGGKTPMTVAVKPNMNAMAAGGRVGLVQTVPEGFSPGSDVANLAVLGYDPRHYYSGRSPLEAVSMGVPISDGQVAMRCNMVTLSTDVSFAKKRMLDYCAGDISTEEARILIEFLQKRFGDESYHFYPGFSYRHCLLAPKGKLLDACLTPPHDITGKVIGGYLPKGQDTEPLLELMEKCNLLLSTHPVNLERMYAGKSPANAVWFWGQGSKPKLDSFKELRGIKGSIISAVDLMKGIAICAGMDAVFVPGATGYIDTNFQGKAQAALDAFASGSDLVYLHVEAPDECGHRGETENKVRSIELIDQLVLKPVLDGLEAYDNYRVLILPDHATPLAIRTHTSEPVPFLLYEKGGLKEKDATIFDENFAASTGLFVPEGHKLIELLVKT